MPLQLSALREALLDAGAAPEKADKAAEEVAAYEDRLAGIDSRLSTLTWMVGTGLTITVLGLGSQFALWAKIGDDAGQVSQIARAVVH